MWIRAELKQRAKEVLRLNYWESLVGVIIAVVMIYAVSLFSGLIFIVIFAASFLGVLFVILPLTVGLNAFFMKNRLAPPDLRNLFYAFGGSRYMKIVGAMAWMYLFTFLWSLIPLSGFAVVLANMAVSGAASLLNVGELLKAVSPAVWTVCFGVFAAGTVIVVIKQISYSMTGFILTDNPNIGYTRALKLSIHMTYGQKWRIFMLALSFLGWLLLGLLALLVGTVFVAPYIGATYAELYAELRDEAVRTGLCSYEELNLPAPQQ